MSPVPGAPQAAGKQRPLLFSRREERGDNIAFATKILLATDGSRDADLVARAAINLANQAGAELHVLYVGEPCPTPPPSIMRCWPGSGWTG